MKRSAALLLACACATLQAAPLERDLGQGLSFCRIHEMPDDLPTGPQLHDKPVVLDLRFVRGNKAAGTALLAWLKFHAGAKSPVFLLANAQTSGELLAPLNSPDAVLGLVILGPAAPDFTPDVALPVSAADDRKAYDALETGAPIDSLVIAKVEKARQDEEMLDREHLPDRDLGDLPTPAEKPAGPPQLIDRVLQRAVQMDRGLLALKRLP